MLVGEWVGGVVVDEVAAMEKPPDALADGAEQARDVVVGGSGELREAELAVGTFAEDAVEGVLGRRDRMHAPSVQRPL